LLRADRRAGAENGYLRVALKSRIVIEQAKGVLVERFALQAEASSSFCCVRRDRRRSSGYALVHLAAKRTRVWWAVRGHEVRTC
jgi:hypothetical protein